MVIFVTIIKITIDNMAKKIALELNSIDMLKHVLFKEYQLPIALANLNLTQERILMTVHNSADLPMVTIARAIGLEKGPFSQTVDKLEELGLMQRVRSKMDKRLVHLELTPEGERVTKLIEESMDAHFEIKMKALSTDQLNDFYAALDTLRQTANILISK